MSSGGPADSEPSPLTPVGHGEPGPEGRDRTDPSAPSAATDELQQRLDKNFNELLQETRVTQTGIQILFAFLLTLPFSNRFDVLTSFQRAIYFVTLMCAGMAVVHLIAPVSYHRILFRHHAKEHIVAVTNTMVMVGLAFTAGAVVGSLVLVTSVLYSWPIATTVAAVFTGLILWLWYLSALLRRRQAVRAR